ncbi:MAG: hypothetical protein FJ222_09990 [Lentisphaerae bacterium]|nr:hypothetical protein [Lentisphaerota bacterium]
MKNTPFHSDGPRKSLAAGAVVGLLLSVSAFAYDAARLIPPASDLVNASKPYVLTAELDGGVSNVMMKVSLRLERREAGLEAVPILCAREAPIPEPTLVPAAKNKTPRLVRRCEIRIDAADLAEGEYTGEVTLEIGERRQQQAIGFFRMPQGKPADFPFGLYAVDFPKTSGELESLLREIRLTGLNLLCLNHMGVLGGRGPIFDRAARLGMQFMPAVNASQGGGDATQILLSDGTRKGACLNHPTVRRESARVLSEWVRTYTNHLAFSGRLYYGDDFTLPLASTGGTNHMACYCGYCCEQFKALTGSDPPIAPANPAGGLVPTDDLWLRWMRYRCGEIFGGFIEAMEHAKNAVDPTVKMGLIHGWSEQPFTRVDVGIYPPLSQPVTALSSYSYPNLRMQRKDLIAHFELARMGHRDKEVWMLGLLAMANTVASPLQVRQNYWNQIAGGYTFISFFSWYDLLKARSAGETNRVQAALDALAACGRHKDWILPVIPFWKSPEATSAVLYSFSTESYDAPRQGGGIEHLRKIMAFLREALAQHVPMKALCEEELLQPENLRALTSLSLCDVRTLPENVHAAIEAYAAGGGHVYLDLDSRIAITGAVKMSVETMVALAGDQVPDRTRVSSPQVSLREFPSGEATFHVLVNNAADRYWGLPFNYRSPQANYVQDALVRDDPVAVTVTFSTKGRWLFDLSTGALLGPSDTPLSLVLEPSWGRVICALPSPSAELRVTGPARAELGSESRFHLEMLDAGGERLEAPFVVTVVVTTPSGRASRYSRPVGFQASDDFMLPLGGNDETGRWTLTFEGGYPRTTKTLRLAVAESERKQENLLTLH